MSLLGEALGTGRALRLIDGGTKALRTVGRGRRTNGEDTNWVGREEASSVWPFGWTSLLNDDSVMKIVRSHFTR
jgi:hypothetical protein